MRTVAWPDYDGWCYVKNEKGRDVALYHIDVFVGSRIRVVVSDLGEHTETTFTVDTLSEAKAIADAFDTPLSKSLTPEENEDFLLAAFGGGRRR